ncbi:hypothetical protein T4E_10306, partial [Trichinella pseudospiralis]
RPQPQHLKPPESVGQVCGLGKREQILRKFWELEVIGINSEPEESQADKVTYFRWHTLLTVIRDKQDTRVL